MSYTCTALTSKNPAVESVILPAGLTNRSGIEDISIEQGMHHFKKCYTEIFNNDSL